MPENLRPIGCALAAAALFGASTPAAKALVGALHPVLLAGLLYAGSGLGLAAWLAARRVCGVGEPLGLRGADLAWLAGAVLAGGVAGPVLLMWGLSRSSAVSASLLLNLESVFTALLAWFAFRENFDRRIAAGMALIVAGGGLLALEPGALAGAALEASPGAALIAAACLAWAIDNNLTRRISGGDATAIAAIKGCVAGSINLSLAAAVGAAWPGTGTALAAAAVGFAGYGVSLVLFVLALRGLGAARTGAYFSTAPFVGVLVALVFLGESPPALFWIAAALMGSGVWLHASERHVHAHTHDPLEHSHPHRHDAHHRHSHAPGDGWDGTEPHTHVHRHEPLRHSHPHYPDLHHQHRH